MDKYRLLSNSGMIFRVKKALFWMSISLSFILLHLSSIVLPPEFILSQIFMPFFCYKFAF